MTELFVPRTNCLLQGNGKEHKTKIHHSLDLQWVVAGLGDTETVDCEILHFKLPEVNPAVPKRALQLPQFPWPCGKAFHFNATLKTLKGFRKKISPSNRAVVHSSGRRDWFL